MRQSNVILQGQCVQRNLLEVGHEDSADCYYCKKEGGDAGESKQWRVREGKSERLVVCNSRCSHRLIRDEAIALLAFVLAAGFAGKNQQNMFFVKAQPSLSSTSSASNSKSTDSLVKPCPCGEAK